MGKQSTYTCDKCGHSQPRDRKFGDKERWMHTVVVGVKEGFEDANYNVRFGSQDIVVSALWCDECLGSFGAKRLSRSAPGEPELRTPTIEDIVRDVVEQALVDKGLI